MYLHTLHHSVLKVGKFRPRKIKSLPPTSQSRAAGSQRGKKVNAFIFFLLSFMSLMMCFDHYRDSAVKAVWISLMTCSFKWYTLNELIKWLPFGSQTVVQGTEGKFLSVTHYSASKPMHKDLDRDTCMRACVCVRMSRNQALVTFFFFFVCQLISSSWTTLCILESLRKLVVHKSSTKSSNEALSIGNGNSNSIKSILGLWTHHCCHNIFQVKSCSLHLLSKAGVWR